MKYRIIILIIIISLGKILLSYIANTSRTHARTHTRAHTHKHTAVAAVQVIALRWRPTVTVRSAGDNAGSWVIQINQCLSQELKKVRHMSHQAEKGETQYHKAETHVSPS